MRGVPTGPSRSVVYAKAGRFGSHKAQGAVGVPRSGDSDQDDESVSRWSAWRQPLLGLDHPVRSYLQDRTRPDLMTPGLVDTPLIGRELTYSVDDCLELNGGRRTIFQTYVQLRPVLRAPALR